MFVSYDTYRTFDRNIFNGQGEKKKLIIKSPVEVLFYFAGNIPVGKIIKDMCVVTYEKFQRRNYIPIKLEHEGKIYCGWVNQKEVVLVG